MWDWLTGIAYQAHGYCLSWDPLLIGVHAGSDFLIFAAYTAIPVAILIFLRKRPSLELKGLGRFFAAFIFWCGLTHLVGLITLWFPIYDIQALVKIITAAISLFTALVVYLLIPKALAIPSPAELQLVNSRLTAEAAAHESTLMKLRAARDDLERRVQERTRSLEEAAQHAEVLVKEIAHRSGNLMSVIAAMARQTASPDIPSDTFVKQLVGRIEAMGRSHDLLFRQSWKNVDLETLVTRQLAPFIGSRKPDVFGPAVSLSPAAAHALGMVFYELATNALKYGALSRPAGNVSVSWKCDGTGPSSRIVITWRETGGPEVREPKRQGWGSKVIGDLTAASLLGEAHVAFDPTGLIWSLSVPEGDSGVFLSAQLQEDRTP